MLNNSRLIRMFHKSVKRMIFKKSVKSLKAAFTVSAQHPIVRVVEKALSEQDCLETQQSIPNPTEVVPRTERNALMTPLNDGVMCEATKPSTSTPLPVIKATAQDSSKSTTPGIVRHIYNVGLTKCFKTANCYKTESVPSALTRSIKDVLAIKLAGGQHFKALKLLGDSCLRNLTYQYLIVALKIEDSIEKRSRAVLQNGASDAMAVFFDKRIKVYHDKQFPVEKQKISSHGKCDVVEALVEHARQHPSTQVLPFIISELFKSLDCRPSPLPHTGTVLHLTV